MTAGVEMLERVRVCRILAAPNMATVKAYPKLVPLRSKRDAFFAAFCAGR
jgi:hypothetical protein